MKITLKAYTKFVEEDGDNFPFTDAEDSSALAEFAGRACYQSWTKPNPKTATNAGYLDHILEERHFSVLRHGSISVYVEGVSRSFSLELIRHHVGTAVSQLSQRYVDADPDDCVIPPAMRGNGPLENKMDRAWAQAIMDYRDTVKILEEEGKTRKQAREAARAFLPGCAETKLVFTGNHEAWRNIIEARGSVHADAEIREFAVEMCRLLKQLEPNIYQDFEVCEGGDGITTVCRRPL